MANIRVIRHKENNNNNFDTARAKLKELKDFIREKNQAVSWTFTMKAVDYRIIAKHIPDHFTEVRIQVKTNDQLPSIYKKDPYKGKWVVLTISK
jgi:hypothetical protein